MENMDYSKIFLTQKPGGNKDLLPGPAFGMFEVFGRTGPQNLGGPQFWTL